MVLSTYEFKEIDNISIDSEEIKPFHKKSYSESNMGEDYYSVFSGVKLPPKLLEKQKQLTLSYEAIDHECQEKFSERPALKGITLSAQVEKMEEEDKSPYYFINTPPPGLTPPRNTKKETDSKSNAFFPSSATKFNFSDNPLNLDKASELFSESKNFENLNQPFILPKKPIILDESRARYCGRLKFFDETKSYGFIIMDEDESDIFVHYDDLLKCSVTKEALRNYKQRGHQLRFSFSCMSYIGKYNKSRKAVELKLLASPPPPTIPSFNYF